MKILSVNTHSRICCGDNLSIIYVVCRLFFSLWNYS